MIEAVVAYTNVADSTQAGIALGAQILSDLQGKQPDALIVFASAVYAYEPLLQALNTTCHPTILVGCSSAGEFISNTQGEGAVSAIAFCSSELRFSAGLGQGLRIDRAAAVEQLAASFQGRHTQEYLYRSALVLTDALAGHTDDLIEQLTVLTGGTYQFFGGGAGDDGKFQHTQVFCGTQVWSDAVVALEILSNTPIGIGVSHGWQPAGEPMRVTHAEGMRLMSVNAMPAVEAIEMHAEATGQPFNPADPIPFFLHNVLGIDSSDGYKLRVPLGIEPSGALNCASDIPTGAIVRVMHTASASAELAAINATEAALAQLKGHRPKIALFFDCVATRLRLGQDFGLELQAVQQALGDAQFAGFNSYGQIARAEGQFSGFHNCTAVVCIISE